MQKMTVSTAQLKPVLKKLAQVVPGKTVLPALMNLYCRVEKTEVEFVTSDLETTIVCKCPVQTDGAPFEVLLPFSFMYRLVNLIPDTSLEIKITGNKALITGPNDTYNLNALESVENYPKMPDIPKRKSLPMDDSLVYWLQKALLTVSRDELRPALTTVCLDITAAGITMVSTDSHTIFTRKFASDAGIVDQLLVRSKVIKAIDGFEKLSIGWTAKNIAFQDDTTTVISRRMDAKYPDYKVVLFDYEKNLQVSKSELMRALEKCILCSEITHKTTFHLKKEEGKIHLAAADIDIERDGDVSIDGAYSGEVESFDIDAGLLLKMLDQIAGDTLNLHISSSQKGILLTVDEDPEYFGMIMPLMGN